MDGELQMMELSIGKLKILGDLNGVKVEISEFSEEMTAEVLKVWEKHLCPI